MISVKLTLILLSIVMTELSANIFDCTDVDVIENTEFDNLQFENVCFNPEKLILINRKTCNIKVNTLKAAFNLLLENGTYIQGLMSFVIEKKFETPCDIFYYEFNKASIEYDWMIESGDLIISVPGYNITNSDYCIKLYKPINYEYYVLQPHLCREPKNVIDVYIRSVSVLFMVLSICVYLFSYLPRYGSIHNKCCTCYIICKTIHFSLRTLDEIALNFGISYPSLLCGLMGFCAYYTVIATYLWLLIINYNIWKSFIGFGTTWQGNFRKFNKFVWSMAFGFFGLIILIDFYYTHEYNQVWSAKSVLLSCWINAYDWMAIIYLHGPVVLLILFNITLSIRTSWHIHNENKKVCRESSNFYTQNQIKNKTNFLFFFRLFLFTGAFSILDKIFSIFVILRVFDYYASLKYAEPVLSLQGVLLFVLTVLRKEVLDSLRERIRGNNNLSNSGTQESEVTN